MVASTASVTTAPRRQTAARPATAEPPRNPAMHGTPAEALVLVVAPGNGRFHPDVATGHVPAGGLVGHLMAGGGHRIEVRCPTDAVIGGLLIRPGQLVTGGQALAWGMDTGVRAA